MNETKPKTHADFVLPPSVVSKLDVARLVKEAERVDSELTTVEARAKAGAKRQKKPVLSEELKDFLAKNDLTFTDSRERSKLVRQLRLLKNKVPVIHMTFSVRADHESLKELAKWLRKSVHPQAVIQPGLQPELVAGVYLRTPNHVHDLSLRNTLGDRREVLVKELEALRGRR